MSKREYRPPREGDKVGMINGWPDSRGYPTVRVVCEGWRNKGAEHKELVVATFTCPPFDPRTECGNWWWDSDAAVGGGPRHDTTRLREDKAKRKVTEAEEERGWRPGYTEMQPKLDVGDMHMRGSVLHLECSRCTSDLRITEAHMQDLLDKTILAEFGVDDDLETILRAGARKIPLPALILIKTKPKAR